MTIRVVCQQCGSKLDIREELAGNTRRCPKCKTEFVVPSPADEEDGVVLVSEEELEAEIPATKSKANSSMKATPRPAGETASDSPLTSAGDGVDASDDDSGGDDFMPSFLTTPSGEAAESKTPLPATAAPDDDDEPVLSIPKTPLAAKPKLKPFDPDEFSKNPPPRSPKREMPASLEERPNRSRRRDEDDSAAENRTKGSRTPARGGFNLPDPAATGLSDPAATTTGGTKDRAQAARELRQALKESALKHPAETEASRGIAIDFAGLMSEIGLKGLAIIAGAVLILPAIYFGFDRMLGSGAKLPRLAYVTGIVTYNGEPAANATVNFQPVEEQKDEKSKKKTQIRTSFGVTDNKGQFKLMYMEGIEGVAVGKCRVWLDLPPPMVLPGEFSTASMTLREVKAGSQTIDFPVQGPVKKK